MVLPWPPGLQGLGLCFAGVKSGSSVGGHDPPEVTCGEQGAGPRRSRDRGPAAEDCVSGSPWRWVGKRKVGGLAGSGGGGPQRPPQASRAGNQARALGRVVSPKGHSWRLLGFPGAPTLGGRVSLSPFLILVTPPTQVQGHPKAPTPHRTPPGPPASESGLSALGSMGRDLRGLWESLAQKPCWSPQAVDKAPQTLVTCQLWRLEV